VPTCGPRISCPGRERPKVLNSSSSASQVKKTQAEVPAGLCLMQVWILWESEDHSYPLHSLLALDGAPFPRSLSLCSLQQADCGDRSGARLPCGGGGITPPLGPTIGAGSGQYRRPSLASGNLPLTCLVIHPTAAAKLPVSSPLLYCR
jgi:hypothetical protein